MARAFFDQLDERTRDRSLGSGQFVEDRIVVACGQDSERNRQSALARGLRIARRLAAQLRQFVASHEQSQRRRAVAEHAEGRERCDLARIEGEFFIEVIERDGLQIEDAADGKAAAKGRVVRHDCSQMPPGRPAADEQPIALEPELEER